MKALWCQACCRPHTFTLGEIERIVYALQGMEHDARLTHAQDRDGMAQCEPWGVEKNRHGYHDVEQDCLRDIHGRSHDAEGYAEWTQSLVDARRAGAARSAA